MKTSKVVLAFLGSNPDLSSKNLGIFKAMVEWVKLSPPKV